VILAGKDDMPEIRIVGTVHARVLGRGEGRKGRSGRNGDSRAFSNRRNRAGFGRTQNDSQDHRPGHADALFWGAVVIIHDCNFDFKGRQKKQ